MQDVDYLKCVLLNCGIR